MAIRILFRTRIRILDPDRHQNIIICSLAQCQSSVKISCKSVSKFLRNVANRQTNNKQQQKHILLDGVYRKSHTVTRIATQFLLSKLLTNYAQQVLGSNFIYGLLQHNVNQPAAITEETDRLFYGHLVSNRVEFKENDLGSSLVVESVCRVDGWSNLAFFAEVQRCEHPCGRAVTGVALHRSLLCDAA